MKNVHALILLPALVVAAGVEFPPLEPRQASASALLSVCLGIVSTCYPTVASCATSFCNTCGFLPDATISGCCNVATNKAICFATAFGAPAATGGSTSSPASVSASPTGASITSVATGTASRSSVIASITTSGLSSAVATAISSGVAFTSDQYYASCRSFFSAYSSCASRTPGFSSLGDPLQASCLCYNNGVYAPSTLQGYASACVTWARTADPTDVTIFQAITTFCLDYPPTSTFGVVSTSSGLINSVTVGPSTTRSGGSTLSTSSSASVRSGAAPQGNVEKQSLLGMLFFGVAALL